MIMPVPTPHITAKEGDFARTVLMPGDPLRSKFIAEHYLENPVLVNNTRGVQGYTGTYKGKRVSVMASGMGNPSMAIYSYELYNFYNVENIIRIGSAGGIRDDIQLRDIVFAMTSYTNSYYGRQFGIDCNVAPCCSFDLLMKAYDAAKHMGITPKVGALYCSDIFYDESNSHEKLRNLGVMAAEMESAALYLNAARAGKNALAICTISDHIFREEALPAEERQTSFTQMMEIALEIA